MVNEGMSTRTTSRGFSWIGAEEILDNIGEESEQSTVTTTATHQATGSAGYRAENE